MTRERWPEDRTLTDRLRFTGPPRCAGYAKRAAKWDAGYRPPLPRWLRNLRAIEAAEKAGQPLPRETVVWMLLSQPEGFETRR